MYKKIVDTESRMLLAQCHTCIYKLRFKFHMYDLFFDLNEESALIFSARSDSNF